MDHDLCAFRRDQDDHLEQVGCGVRADEQPTVGVFSSIFDRERMFDCVNDVLVGDAVLARRGRRRPRSARRPSRGSNRG
jgi:hypothetical protein